jgi:hypothetical protein
MDENGKSKAGSSGKGGSKTKSGGSDNGGEERLIRGDMTNDATKKFVASLLYLPIVSQKRRIITGVMHEKI